MTVRVVARADGSGAGDGRVGSSEGVLQALSRYGIRDVTVEDPYPAEGFDNFQVWCGGREIDVTAAFQEFAQHARGATSGLGAATGPAGWSR